MTPPCSYKLLEPTSLQIGSINKQMKLLHDLQKVAFPGKKGKWETYSDKMGYLNNS